MNKQLRPKTKTGEEAFQQMEERITSIHYFFCHADLPSDVRQVMTYRKLMALEYFTPKAAQALLRQWNQADPTPTESSARTPAPPQARTTSRPLAPRTTGSTPLTSKPRSRQTISDRLSFGFNSGSRPLSRTVSKPETPPEQIIDPQRVKDLSSQLNTAVSQQEWDQAIQILDQMICLVPDQRAELSAYRENLCALVGTPS